MNSSAKNAPPIVEPLEILKEEFELDELPGRVFISAGIAVGIVSFFYHAALSKSWAVDPVSHYLTSELV